MANPEREPGSSGHNLKVTRRQALVGTGAVLGGIVVGYGPRWLRNLLATEPPIEAAAKGIEPVVTPVVKSATPIVEASPAAPASAAEPTVTAALPTATSTSKPAETPTVTPTVVPTNTPTEVPPTPTAAPTKTPEPTSTPTPDASATAQAEQIKQTELNKMAKQIGVPDKYRPATEEEIAYFVPAKKGEKPYIERITLKIEGNKVLVPDYAKGSIIGNYNPNFKILYPEEYWLGEEQTRYEWIAGLENAVFALLQGDSKEVRRNLLWVQKQIKGSNLSSAQKKLDKNGDGVADYMEELSKGVNALLKKL